MSFFTCLYWLFIEPIKILLEAIYSVVFELIESPGLTIVFLSLAVNLLVLPLYKRADAIQEEQFQIQQKMKKWTEHIKKTFKGDERFMMLQTYYRQNNYKPTDALKGSVSLLLQIPFFMAAYDFLSNLYILKESSFGLIADLSKPDGMLVIGGLAINILPVLMTVFNIISTVIYTKGKPIGTKIQAYVLAALFLVLLYNSPSGLAFYWMLNNAFSLLKNVFEKGITKSNLTSTKIFSDFINVIKLPKLSFCIWCSVIGILAFALEKIMYFYLNRVQTVSLIIIAISLQIPIVLFIINKVKDCTVIEITKKEKILFLLNCIFMAILTGVLIPSAVINSSPEEFMNLNTHINPLFDILKTGCIAFGFFVIWFSVFYYMFKPKAKRAMVLCMIVSAPASVINYMFYGKNYGILLPTLNYENGVFVHNPEMWVNLIAIVAIGVIAYILWRKKPDLLSNIIIVAGIALVGMSGYNIINSNKIIVNTEHKLEIQNSSKPHFTLSRNGKNVVVLMMDRAISSYLPYAFAEKPELQKQFEGFTYFPNTTSYGSCTIFGTPGLFGGYEYIPVEMCKKDDELLVDKHNRALKVLPKIFGSNDCEVTVFNPPYAGYEEISDLSIYDDCKNTKAYNLDTWSYYMEDMDTTEDNYESRPFFKYGIFKISPVFAHEFIYNHGSYLTVVKRKVQTIHNIKKAVGNPVLFLGELKVIEKLSEIGTITDDDTNTLFMMDSILPHTPTLLQLPDYTSQFYVDNSMYSSLYNNKPDLNGNTINLVNQTQVLHYHANMAMYLALGKWLDYLRENDIYDNTKIIIVSDHGWDLNQFDDMLITGEVQDDLTRFNALLMVKDFNSSGELYIDEHFMTNADVPTLVTKDVIADPKNPFTGKSINSDAKNRIQYITGSRDFNVKTNNGKAYTPDIWYAVDGDANNPDKWTYLGTGVLPPGYNPDN